MPVRMILFNHHTHSSFCDGTSDPEVYIKEALKLGFASLGFSSHAPVPFENTFALPDDRCNDYKNRIRELQKKYEDQIEIYLALEIDYIPNVTRDFSFYRKEMGLDYTIGGVHLIKKENSNEGLWFIDGPRTASYDEGLQTLFHNDIKAGVKAYYHTICEMATTQQPDIIAHFDKIKMHNQNRYFTEDEKWYTDLVDETLAVIAEAGCIVEINTRGIYKKRCPDLFPSLSILKKLHKLHVPITISTDTHAPEELILGMDLARKAALQAGYKEIFRFSQGLWWPEEIV